MLYVIKINEFLIFNQISCNFSMPIEKFQFQERIKEIIQISINEKYKNNDRMSPNTIPNKVKEVKNLD